MVSIRAAAGADAETISRIYSAYVTASLATFEEEPPDARSMAARMEDTPRLPWLVAVRSDVVVGYAYASQHRARVGYRWSVDCSVYLHPSEQGHGTGRALYDRLLPELRALGYVSAYAGIALPNPASIALHESVGFTTVGVFRDVGFKHGSWLDVGWWQRALQDPPAAPTTPVCWTPEPGPPG